jgi:hypothetical protein
MKLDKLILRRFEELEEKAGTVSAARQFDFRSREGKDYYNIPSAIFRGWGTSVLNLLQRAFGENSIHYRNFYEHYEGFTKWESEFEDCRAIFIAAKEDYAGGYLFDIRSLIKAEVLDDALEQATELLNAGYKDPACVVAGVVLETILKEICTRENIPHGKLDRMNVELCKAGIYNMAKQKQITAWAHLRNKAAHGDWTACDEADVNDLIEGVRVYCGLPLEGQASPSIIEPKNSNEYEEAKDEKTGFYRTTDPRRGDDCGLLPGVRCLQLRIHRA